MILSYGVKMVKNIRAKIKIDKNHPMKKGIIYTELIDMEAFRKLDSERHWNWSINSEMHPKFGNGKIYSFYPIEGEDVRGDYTHKCHEDRWYYHYLWFKTPIPILESELFEI